MAFPLQEEKMVPGLTPVESEEHYKLINRVKLNHCQGFDGTLKPRRYGSFLKQISRYLFHSMNA